MKKLLIGIAVILASIIIGLAIAPFFIDEPLRRYAEQKLNDSLPGFTARIDALRTRPLALSIDLENIVITQTAHPDPPVAVLPRVHGGLHWLALFTLRVVADARADDPRLFVSLENLKPLLEKLKKAPPSKTHWQDALMQLPPFTVSEFRLANGSVTVVPEAKAEALSVTGITTEVRNVQNVRARPGELPTRLFFEAVLPGNGRVTMNGAADLLQKPVLSIRADADLKHIELARFKDLAKPLLIVVTKGLVEGAVSVEMTPERKLFILKDLTVKDPAVDYLYYEVPLPEEVKEEKKAETAEKAKELQRKVVNKPGLLIMASKVRIAGGSLGIVNKSAKPNYRLFMDDLDLDLNNISNHFDEGEGKLALKGKFMGSGVTTASGNFRPEKAGPDFSLRIAIKDTRMRSLNDLFRAYGNFDVSAGYFSFYSELTVVRSQVDGYVKPLFRDIKVYDKRTDKQKGEFHKLYEELIGGLAKLLENRPRNAVATKTPVTGTLGSPETSTWRAVVNIIRNAFFSAILPGFERNIKR